MLNIKFYVDILGDHKASEEELIKITSKKVNSIQEALDFMSECTVCVNSEELFDSINKDIDNNDLIIKEKELLLDREDFKSFNDKKY